MVLNIVGELFATYCVPVDEADVEHMIRYVHIESMYSAQRKLRAVFKLHDERILYVAVNDDESISAFRDSYAEIVKDFIDEDELKELGWPAA